MADLTNSPALRAVVGSRIIVWCAGLLALAIFRRNPAAVSLLDPNGASAPFHSGAANFILSPAARWDSIWYLQIAHDGYFSLQSSGMFPLYPLLLRLGSMVFYSELIVGLAISLAGMVVGLVLLERLIGADFDARIGRTTVYLMAFFPVAFFFSAVYTESLYLALSVGALYAARRERWALAALLGGFAAATRSAGVLLALPLVLMYLYGPRSTAPAADATRRWAPRYRVTPSLAWLALVPTGLAVYLVYLAITHGQPLAPFHAQQYWGRSFAGPFGALWHGLLSLPDDVRRVLAGTGRPVGPGDPLGRSAHNLIDLGFVAFAAVGLVGAWRRIPIAYLAYGIVLLGQALSYPTAHEPLASIPRYILVVFPAFLGWALLLDRRPRWTRAALCSSAALLGVFSGLWTMWAWIA